VPRARRTGTGTDSGLYSTDPALPTSGAAPQARGGTATTDSRRAAGREWVSLIADLQFAGLAENPVQLAA
jgi:hypothetical protein